MISCFVFKQKTAYEMRISDWSSDVCSSDLLGLMARFEALPQHRERELRMQINGRSYPFGDFTGLKPFDYIAFVPQWDLLDLLADEARRYPNFRSEEHTSELQSLMRISYAVFCLKKKNRHKTIMKQGR